MRNVVIVVVIVVVVVVVMAAMTTRDIVVAICCIDDRADELPDCLAALRRHAAVRDWVIVTRPCDARCRRFGGPDHTLLVDDYPDPPPGRRHDYAGIARQRTAALRWATRRPPVDLWFVDSDIRVRRDTLTALRIGRVVFGGDIVAVPYGVRWDGMRRVVGALDPQTGAPIIRRVDPSPWPFRRCHAVGMGCTLIADNGGRLPSRFTVTSRAGIVGEDIGFCIDAHDRGATILYAAWASPPAHIA